MKDKNEDVAEAHIMHSATERFNETEIKPLITCLLLEETKAAISNTLSIPIVMKPCGIMENMLRAEIRHSNVLTGSICIESRKAKEKNSSLTPQERK